MLDSFVSFGKYGQWVAAFTGAAMVFISGNVASWPAVALPKIEDGTAGFSLTPGEQSLVVTMMYVGAAISPVPCSFIMDRIGRRNILIVNTLIAMSVWTIFCCSTSLGFLITARVLSGVYCGIEYTVVANFIAETVSPEIRGRLGTLMIIMFTGGAFFISLIAHLSYPSVCVICLIVSVLLFVCVCCVPETPYFYLMRGNRGAAEKSEKWLRGTCFTRDLDRIEEAVKEQQQNSGSYLDIFRDKVNFKSFIMVIVLKFVASCSSYVFLMLYSPLIIPDSWVSSAGSYTVLCIVCLVTGMVTSFFIDRFNRRSVMVVSCTGSAVALCGLSVWYYLKDMTSVDVSSTKWLPLLLAILSEFFEVTGLSNVPNMYKAEVFNINIKSKACALACVTALIFEGLNNYVYFPINDHVGRYFNFMKSMLTAMVGIVFAVFFMIETRGKSLEEIQDILNGRRERIDDQDQEERIECDAGEQ